MAQGILVMAQGILAMASRVPLRIIPDSLMSALGGVIFLKS